MFVIVNNKVFRIIRVNGDGTLRVMLNEVVLASDYGFEDYSTSTLRTTLKNWYNVNMSGLSYVVEGDFDNNNYDKTYNVKTNDEGIAICKCVYPGSIISVYSSAF